MPVACTARPTVLMVALALAALLGACRETPAPTLEPVGAARVEALRDRCTRDGGVLSAAGRGGSLVCLRETRDAGRQCRAAGDCSGECLARSGTCAPVVPLLGCHEVFLADGRVSRQCLE